MCLALTKHRHILQLHISFGGYGLRPPTKKVMKQLTNIFQRGNTKKLFIAALGALFVSNAASATDVKPKTYQVSCYGYDRTVLHVEAYEFNINISVMDNGLQRVEVIDVKNKTNIVFGNVLCTLEQK